MSLLSTAQPRQRTVRGNCQTVINAPKWWRCDVVIAVGPNDGGFLDECLESIRLQDQSRIASVIVVDDGANIAERPGVIVLKSEARNSHQSRAIGVSHGSAPLIQFVDVDNKLAANHVESCCRLFEKNQNLGLVYSDIQMFGDVNELYQQPRHIDLTMLRRANSCDTNSMLRREAVEQTGVMRQQPSGFEDWWIAFRLLEAGWQAEWQPVPFFYRIRAGQRSATERIMPFYQQTSCVNETVTIFCTVSKRTLIYPELWQRRVKWLKSQTWPRSQTRILIANTSGRELPHNWFAGLPWSEFAGVSVYSHELGQPGLEMAPRINRPDNQRMIQTVVAALNNRALNEAQTELMLFLEDDVFPRCDDVIARMVKSVGGMTAAVAAPYRLRFAPFKFSVWTKPPQGTCPENLQEPGEGVEDIEGCGFGCTLVRRSQVAGFMMTGNTESSEFYDVDWSVRIRAAGMRIHVDWSLECDHVQPTGGPAQ